MTSVWVSDQNALCVLGREWSGMVWSTDKFMWEGLWPWAVGGMNGQAFGFFPSSVFQDIPGHVCDFRSASAATTGTTFHHHAAKLCPVDGWWSWHRGCRLLWEWYCQVRKQTVIMNRPGVISHKPAILCPSAAIRALFKFVYWRTGDISWGGRCLYVNIKHYLDYLTH